MSNNIIFEVHKAHQGDALLISYAKGSKTKRILIDGGQANTFSDDPSDLYKKLREVRREGGCIDLLIITHYDSDHIGGILAMFESREFRTGFIKKVWFNSGTTIREKYKEVLDRIENEDDYLIQMQDPKRFIVSPGQGYDLQKHLLTQGIWNDQKLILRLEEHPEIQEELGAKITILSPGPAQLKKLLKHWETELDIKKHKVAGQSSRWDYDQTLEELAAKEFTPDKKSPNGSSIAIILEIGGKKLLLLGDAWAPTIVESLRKLGYSSKNRLKVDYVKVSHHGSKKNTNEDLLNLIECSKFIMSTNGKSHYHPNKECIARIIMDHVKKRNTQKLFFYFNYPNPEFDNLLKVDGKDVKKKFNFDFFIKYEHKPLRFEMESES